MPQFIWEVEIFKSGSDECFEKLHFIGDSLIRVSHIAEYYIYEEDMYDFSVEVGSIKRVRGIGKIVNANDFSEEESEYNPTWPIEAAKNLPDEDVLVFKCDCGENLRVPAGNWPYVVCSNPKCKAKIFRREIKDVGGLIIYSRIDELHRNE